MKKRAKGHAILKAKSAIKPPDFNIMDYNLSLMRCLNYYAAEVPSAHKKTYALQYWKKQGKSTKELVKLSDSWFNTCGALAHLALSDIPLHEHDLIKLDNKYNELLKVAREEKEEPSESKLSFEAKKSIQDYIEESASNHIAEVEGMIDDFLMNKKAPDVKGYLTSHQVKAPVAKKVCDWFKSKLKDLQSVSDSEYVEAYGGKRNLNKLVNLYQAIVTDCDTIAVIAKTTRAPRKRKEKPASVLVSKMKWMKEYPDLGMKSIHPEKIVNASELWIYDTEKRRLVKYVANDGYLLSVKGTTIMNFDPTKSGSKIIRKPELLKQQSFDGKRQINNFFNSIKATVGKVTGRTNDKQVIFKVF